MKNVYTDSTEEYQALRGGCGLLDHDGTALMSVVGPGAATFLGEVSTRSVAFLLEGQSSSALLLTDAGTVLAELLVHCRPDGFLVEVWAAQAPAARAHLQRSATAAPGVEIIDLTDRYSVLAVEGPESFRAVAPLLPFPVSSMAYRSFVTTGWSGTELLLSRTGVTGEYGYKLHVPAEHADALRAELLAAGAVPCGLDALDVCRMEMRFVNFERESGGRPLTPFEFGVQWMVDFGNDFAGRQALVEAWEAGTPSSPVCWVADAGADPGASTPETGLELTVDGSVVGAVAHAVYSPGLGRVIGTARVARRVAGSGLTFELGDTGRTVRTISAPFLVATSFGVPMD